MLKHVQSWIVYIGSFLPTILGRNQDFPKGSFWRRVTFQRGLGERVSGKNLNFQICAWGEVWFLTIYNVCRHFRLENLPICSGIIVWFLKIRMKIHEKEVCGGSHFWKLRGRNRFEEELKILDFLRGDWPWVTLWFTFRLCQIHTSPLL